MNHAGLYIHIPFCQAKCGYCSFNSLPANRHTADAYLQTIHQQVNLYCLQAKVKALTFDSIFFGGGTPTLASPEKLSTLLHYLLDHFPFSPDLEISIEANPNSVTFQDLQLLYRAGFNRLSLGIQSFDDHILKRINRTHTGDQAKQAISWARDAGFTNLNCDLIYGLPEQTIDHWHKDLQTIARIKPEHLSMYELSIEQGTAFHAQQMAQTLSLPGDDDLADMEDMSKKILTSIYDQYEISNFSQTGKQCRHNLTYWHNGSYLGLGAGAVSCIDNVRFTHQPAPALFMDAVQNKQSTITQSECLSPKARFRETMVMGLRLVHGVNMTKLEQQSKLSHEQVYGPLITELINKKHLVQRNHNLYIPAPLLGIANQILHQLV